MRQQDIVEWQSKAVNFLAEVLDVNHASALAVLQNGVKALHFFFRTNTLESTERQEEVKSESLFSSCLIEPTVCISWGQYFHSTWQTYTFLSPSLHCSVMPLRAGSALLHATAVWRQEWKGQRSQHLVSIDQVLFQCHPGVSGVCCRCHSVLQEGDLL